ncbi:hypothetical protein VDG1235_1530 [Verrucomicrobiia bacterium DG1235]|nr:hypothetical protein VDG1235_1530 [Verrucomicrobiae bacterium DG1235]
MIRIWVPSSATLQTRSSKTPARHAILPPTTQFPSSFILHPSSFILHPPHHPAKKSKRKLEIHFAVSYSKDPIKSSP